MSELKGTRGYLSLWISRVETLVSLHKPEQTLSHENSGCPKLPSKFLAREQFDFESSNSQSNVTCFTILPLK